MITLADGNKFRDKVNDPQTLEGYVQDPTNPKILVQQFLPCKHRVQRVCSTCPASRQKKLRPSCVKKKITAALNCVGCLEREI